MTIPTPPQTRHQAGRRCARQSSVVGGAARRMRRVHPGQCRCRFPIHSRESPLQQRGDPGIAGSGAAGSPAVTQFRTLSTGPPASVPMIKIAVPPGEVVPLQSPAPILGTLIEESPFHARYEREGPGRCCSSVNGTTNFRTLDGAGKVI
jgi:hypothetical protein